jgi:endonuclease/exonuclease/phosphatase family metal-dependent hydrolase
VPTKSADLRIVTYNIHRARGMDRRTRPDRIADVLAHINADVIALQEVIGPGLTGPGHAEEIGARLGMGWVMAPARELRRHQFGNMVLSRFPIRDHSQHDLTWKTSEPRCIQRVQIDLGPGCAEIYNVHLGTALLERRYQTVRLAEWIHGSPAAHGGPHKHAGTLPAIVLGDFNEWGRGRASKALRAPLQSVELFPHVRRRTYPGFFPLFHLDHIYYIGNVEVKRVDLSRTRLAKMASDHLPLVADVQVSF